MLYAMRFYYTLPYCAVDATFVGGVAEQGCAPRTIIPVAKIISGGLAMLRRRVTNVGELKEGLREFAVDG